MKCFQAQLWGQCLCVCVYKHTHTDIQPYSCDCLWCRILLCRKHYRGREKWDLLSQATVLHVSRKAVCTSHSPSLFRTALESFHKDPFFCNQDPILYRCSQWDMFRWYITKTSVLRKVSCGACLTDKAGKSKYNQHVPSWQHTWDLLSILSQI